MRTIAVVGWDEKYNYNVQKKGARHLRRIIQVVRRKGTSWRSQKAQKICEKLSYMHKREDEVVHNDQKKRVQNCAI